MSINLLESLSDNIAVDADKCVACGLCVEVCILDNLRLQAAPCSRACPLGVNPRGYARLIARGQDEEALKLLRQVLPFPAILGRVCSQPCEARCFRATSDEAEPVALRALKRYLADRIAEQEMPVPALEPNTGKRVAVIGSGPAGMMAAYDLRLRGHAVVVFEAEAQPGGLLRWAIPEFRLPLAVLEAELGLLRRMGVEFQCGIRVGKDLSLAQIQGEFDAAVAATGCSDFHRLDIEGENLAGVTHALPFLRSVRAGQPFQVGERVVVIGGGNAAIDAAQTALRLGARQVFVVCLESSAELPAFPWAVQTALLEKICFEHCWGSVRFLGQSGAVRAVEAQRCLRVYDESGAFAPRFDPSDRRTFPADTVIVAVGQRRDLCALEGAGLSRDGEAWADPLTLETANERIFLAGDLVSGSSTVVEAMASGRQAAESVNRFLRGEPLAYGRGCAGPILTDFPILIRADLPKKRAALPLRPCPSRGSFVEIEQAYDQQTARQEASRCNACGQPVGFYRTCWFCLPCEVECPYEALRVEIPYLLR